MPGIIPLSGLQLGVETTAGTAVPTTRELYPSPAGYFDPGIVVSRHEGAQRGTFSNVTYGTVLSHLPTIGFVTDPTRGLAWDEIPIIMSQLEAGLTGANTTADKDWALTAPVGGTTATFDTYTINAFDATQAYEIDYAFATAFSISGGFDDLTQASIDFVGRTASKVTADTVAANNAVTIPSSLWTIKYATSLAGLAGAGTLDNTLRSWNLTVQLPQHPRFYAGSGKEFGRGVASRNLAGTLEMTWDSESNAVTQYDRFVAQSLSFFRLAATGPAIGSGNYAAEIDVCVLWDPVTPMASESDGVMEYTMTGHLANDATMAGSIDMSATCSIAALP